MMNTRTQHPFSIDFITRDELRSEETENLGFNLYNVCQSGDGNEKSQGNRQTPSPSDSGLESDHSPSRYSDKDNSIAEVLLSLEKNVTCQKSKVTDSSADKPSQSYIALISLAILSTPERKMLLSDIYQYVMDNFDYYNNNEKAWRNSIRHNLSLNECFIKAGRADNGKGNYWTIHPACINDFANGDFRRRQARRRARKCQKESTHPYAPSSAHRYNLGYVPMTASHIAFHPYNNTSGASSMYYPQSHVYSSLGHAHQQSVSPSAFSYTGQPQGSLLSACALSDQQARTSSAMQSHKYFTEQTSSAALTMQALAQQQLASNLQMQNW